jgi:hypothetical protein
MKKEELDFKAKLAAQAAAEKELQALGAGFSQPLTVESAKA